MIFKTVSQSFRRVFSGLLLASLLLAGQEAHPAYAVSYVVNTLKDGTTSDSVCTLREAILAANNTPANFDCGAWSTADDAIIFSVSGTITLASTLPNIVSASMAGKLTIDGGGKITISGNDSVRVIYVNSGAELTLQNLTIAKGKASGGGGGVYNAAGTLTIVNSTFSTNSATLGGGGVENRGKLTIANSIFSGNSVTSGNGGGVNNDTGGTLTIRDSTFSANSASSYGGGVFNSGSGTLTVANSTFSANSADFSGGGVYNAGGTLTITNSTFSANSATNGSGGGVLNSGSGTLTVTNSSFSGNTAGIVGGGVYISSGTAILKNIIIANSPSGGDCVGSLSGLQINNLIEDSVHACGLTNGSNGNIIGQDPKLGALTGSPAYFPLNFGSPAIDAGNNTTCASPLVNNQSQNGITRPQDGDGNGTAVCDIGSYEAPAIFFVYLPLIVK